MSLSLRPCLILLLLLVYAATNPASCEEVEPPEDVGTAVNRTETVSATPSDATNDTLVVDTQPQDTNFTLEDEGTKGEIENIFNASGSAPVDLKDIESRAAEDADDEYGGAVGPNESAAILSGVFVLLAISGYAGFILYRKFLEKRYGTTEMLITDDVYDISDLRNFEI